MNPYEVNLDNLAKRAKMMRANSKRVLAPEAKQNMISAAEKYEAFVRAARAGRVPTLFPSEAQYEEALNKFAGERRAANVERTPAEWNAMRESSVDEILRDTTNVREYDPEALERLSQEPRLAGKPTGEAWALLAAEMRAGRVPTRLPKGRALELARLLVHEDRHQPKSNDALDRQSHRDQLLPFWSRWLRKK